MESPRTTTLSMLVVGFVVAIGIVLAACAGVAERINPGTTAVIIDYTAGVDQNGIPKDYKVVPAGEYTSYNAVTQRLVEYPTKDNTLVMVRATSEGKVTGDDSVACQDKAGILINVDSRTTWAVDPAPLEIVQLYLRRPGMPLTSSDPKDQNNIEDQEVRPAVRAAIPLACSDFSYGDIAGAGRQKFYDDATTKVKAELAKVHLVMRSFQLGETYLQDAQAKTLADTAAAQQAVLTAQYAKQKAEADAAAAIAKNDGENKIKVDTANAEAQAITTINKALAQSPDYINYVYANHWDGHTPQVVSSGGNGQQSSLVLGVPQPQATPQPGK